MIFDKNPTYSASVFLFGSKPSTHSVVKRHAVAWSPLREGNGLPNLGEKGVKFYNLLA